MEKLRGSKFFFSCLGGGGVGMGVGGIYVLLQARRNGDIIRSGFGEC